MSDSVLDIVPYYAFQLLYLGHPSIVLAHLWLSYDMAYDYKKPGDHKGNEDPIALAWGKFDESMRESYKAISVLAGLIAAAVSGLFAIDRYGDHTVVRVLLLASLTSSVISAASCISLLSTVHVDPLVIEHTWRIYGLFYVIVLAGPSAWLSIALCTLQAALLAIVWLGEGTGARVVVVMLIVFRFLIQVGTRWNGSKLLHSKSEDFALGLLGLGQGLNHQMANLTDVTEQKRKRFLEELQNVLEINGGVVHPHPTAILHAQVTKANQPLTSPQTPQSEYNRGGPLLDPKAFLAAQGGVFKAAEPRHVDQTDEEIG